jgi:hypothetical protein
MTGGRQEPFIYGSLGGATISLVPEITRVAPAPPVAAAPAPPSPSVPTPLKPVEVSPARAPPPLPSQAAPQTGDPCVRDEARLARLRANPVSEEIINFQREVACARLRPQVQRLFESFAGETALPSGGNPAPQTVPKQQAQNESVRSEDTCTRDMARLLSIRAEPTLDAITKFEKELGCERLRSQLRRLRESVTP